MSRGTKTVPSMEKFMWFSFIYISLLTLHKTHIILYVRAHEKSFYIPLLPTHTNAHTHQHGSQAHTYRSTITVYSGLAFTVRNSVKCARPLLFLECTSEHTLHCVSAPLNAPPAGSLTTSRCLSWQNKLRQLNGKSSAGFRACEATLANTV